MKRTIVGVFVLVAFGAGVLAGQASYREPEPDPFYYAEMLDTKEGHRIGLFHKTNNPKQWDVTRRGKCQITFWRRYTAVGTSGESLTQELDVRFCQWAQQK